MATPDTLDIGFNENPEVPMTARAYRHHRVPVVLFWIAWLLWSVSLSMLAGCSKNEASPLAPKAPATPPPSSNAAPEIMSLSVNPPQVLIGKNADVVADARDADGDGLTYTWSADRGTLFGSGSTVVYASAACCAGSDNIRLTVTDARGASASAIATIEVVIY